MTKSIKEIINDVLEEVSNSNVGPLFYSVKEGKVVAHKTGIQDGSDGDARFNINPVAMDTFKICLIAKIGLTVNDNISGDDWKGNR